MKSTGKQNRNGRAFEYAIAVQYHSYLEKRGINTLLVEDKNMRNARECHASLSEEEMRGFDNAAANTIQTIVLLEPGLVNPKAGDGIILTRQ